MRAADSTASTGGRDVTKPSGLILVPIAALHAIALAVCGAEAISLLLVAELGLVGAWASVGWLHAVSRLRVAPRSARPVAVPVSR